MKMRLARKEIFQRVFDLALLLGLALPGLFAYDLANSDPSPGRTIRSEVLVTGMLAKI